MTTPLIHLAGDTARSRRSDPPQSHHAADVSSYARKKVLLGVLEMVREDGPLTGSEINDDYRSWHSVDPARFPKCHPDSGRKRAGEAADDGLLDVVAHKRSPFGTEEAVYRISPEGRALLESLDR